MKEWMGADLSGLDIMVVQIDGIHIGEHLVLVAALGIDSEGFKHPLGLMEGVPRRSAIEAVHRGHADVEAESSGGCFVAYRL
jgi:putative transposase